VDYDEVRIHFYPEHISPAIDNCERNENRVRVDASIHIYINQKAKIIEVTNALLNQELVAEQVISDGYTCQMVIDFIRKSKIYSTVAISDHEVVRLDENTDKYYKANTSITSFYSKYLRFFREGK